MSLSAGDLLSAGALHPIPCLKGKKLIANVGKKELRFNYTNDYFSSLGSLMGLGELIFRL